MDLTQKELDQLARLACLSPLPAESSLAQDLNQIMDFVDQLAAMDTAGVEPLYRPHEAAQPLREDAVTEADCVSALETISPSFDEGFYWVPQVIETEE